VFPLGYGRQKKLGGRSDPAELDDLVFWFSCKSGVLDAGFWMLDEDIAIFYPASSIERLNLLCPSTRALTAEAVNALIESV
jgi:hypothetical protein